MELTERLAQIELLLKGTAMPAKLPSSDALDDWLLRIRRKELKHNATPPPPSLVWSVESSLAAIVKNLPVVGSHLLCVANSMVVYALPTTSALSIVPCPAGDKVRVIQAYIFSSLNWTFFV